MCQKLTFSDQVEVYIDKNIVQCTVFIATRLGVFSGRRSFNVGVTLANVLDFGATVK